MKKILYVVSSLILFAGCINLDFYRSDTMTTAKLASDPSSAVYTTDGLYSMLKDVLMYRGSENSNNTYMRHLFQMTEFRGDNICLSGSTSDPLYDANALIDNTSTLNTGYFWYVSYKIIYGANANIAGIVDGTTAEGDHLKGENYFLRALMHLNLVNFFGKPYAVDKTAPGVIIRTSTDCSTTTRATVEEVYNQVEKDLKEAIRLMGNGGSRRGDNGYVSLEAAKALLSRVYLHMERWDDCISVCDELLGAGNAAAGKLLTTDELPTFFQTAPTNKECIWCIDINTTDVPTMKGTIGSMYYSPDAIGSTGWCEIYVSDPLLELFGHNPTDVRYTSFIELMDRKDGYMVDWPIEGGGNFRANALVVAGVTKNSTGNFSFSYNGTSYTTTSEVVNGYPQYYITYEGAKTKVYVHPETVNSIALGARNTYPAYMVRKFAGTFDKTDKELSMYTSPCILRYGEVLLNRAEAEAHNGADAAAMADVEIIRNRAGIGGTLTAANMATYGYQNTLDVVLDERRLELCFEGFRALDMIRNKKDIDRQFGGVQPYEVVGYNDDRLQYKIPTEETLVSGIK